MPSIATRAPRVGNLVKAEQLLEHGYCREGVTVNVASETTLSVGSVLGKVTSSGKYVTSDPDAVDGSEVAAAICLENKTVAATTDTEVAVLIRGAAIVGRDALVYDVDHDATEAGVAEAELEALGILVRTQI
jgi:hypothetical protein